MKRNHRILITPHKGLVCCYREEMVREQKRTRILKDVKRSKVSEGGSYN